MNDLVPHLQAEIERLRAENDELRLHAEALLEGQRVMSREMGHLRANALTVEEAGILLRIVRGDTAMWRDVHVQIERAAAWKLERIASQNDRSRG